MSAKCRRCDVEVKDLRTDIPAVCMTCWFKLKEERRAHLAECDVPDKHSRD